MKYILIFIVTIISLYGGTIFAREELLWEIDDFSCNTGCYLPIKTGFDYLEVQWNIKWFAYLWYWYWSWWEPVIVEYIPVHGYGTLKQKFEFSLDNSIRQKDMFLTVFLPQPLQVILDIPKLEISLYNLNFSEKIWKFFKDVFVIDSQYRVFDVYYWYWKSILSINIVSCLYILFIIWACILLLFVWRKKWSRYILYGGVASFLLLWILDLVDHSAMLGRGLSDYTFWSSKQFFDMGPEYASLTKNIPLIKDTLDDQDCSFLIPVLDMLKLKYFLPLIYPCDWKNIDPNQDPKPYAQEFKYMFINGDLVRNR